MDAGTKQPGHYAAAMHPYVFWARGHLLKIVRAETSVLASLQARVRRPLLDWYFAVSANIGTHTFYMFMLPVSFWFFDPLVGLDIVWLLALGVFLTGFIKDLFCLPRPRSPPLHRISMSGSAILEYGMPSTHSCNAISTSMLVHQVFPGNKIASAIATWMLVTLICGRLYNGMHGFFDIIVGCAFGVLSFHLREVIKIYSSPSVAWHNLVITITAVLCISLYPSPVDNCPCFDDSVAFIGVVLGLLWALCVGAHPYVKFDTSRFEGQSRGLMLLFALARFAVGALLIVLWRNLAKRFLLWALPPIWRALEKAGIQNPRRYFEQASKNSAVPREGVKDHIPDSAGDVVKIVHNISHIRHPSDLIGPQSEADLYELRAREAKNKPLAPVDTSSVEEPRRHYDFEVTLRLILYAGISVVALNLAPIIFKLLHV